MLLRLAGIEFSDNEVASIVMEYIPGDTLNLFIRNEVYLEETLIKSFTKQLVNAISYMHCKIS
jgi:serine/threonine protein kinase